MKTYTNIEQVKADIKDGVFAVDDDIEIAFDRFDIDADIKCNNIYSKDYPRNISARNISARDINAEDINAEDINAWDISARNISARNISARDINAFDINAGDISYYCVCFAYSKLECKSIAGIRTKCKHLCLDSEIVIKQEQDDDIIELNGVKYRKV